MVPGVRMRSEHCMSNRRKVGPKVKHKKRFWYEGDTSAHEFGWLYRLLEGFLHPEVNDFDALYEFVRSDDPAAGLFRQQLQEAMQNFDEEIEYHLDYITAYDDGSGDRYLRRVWRDLYPGEPVPGGDEEFRAALRQTILDNPHPLPLILTYYIDFRLPDFRPDARAVWQRHFPNEPVPVS